MKLNKIINKVCFGAGILFSTMAFTSCEAGLEYKEALESQYTQVGVNAVTIQARELFENKMYAINWGNKVVENYIDTKTVGQTGTFKYKNTSNGVVTLNDGTKVQPGETVEVTSTKTEETLEEAPDGKLTVFNIYVVDHAKYKSPNKGYLFAKDLFDGTGEFELVNPENNRSEEVILPIRKNELIGQITCTSSNYDCVVERVGDSPVLGVPGDFTQAKIRYIVKNIAHRPAGVPQSKAMYEIRITFLPGVIG